MSDELCDMLHCVGQRQHTLQFRPPGHASHEGTFLYHVCDAHLAQYEGEPGYRSVTWDADRLRYAPTPHG